MTMRGSLTASLIAWALGALLIVWGCFVVLGYQTGIHEADELTDGHLASVAMLELAGPIDASTGRERDNAVPERADLKAHDYQRSMSVLVWDSSGNVLMRSGPAPLVPFSATEGFETLHLGAPAVAWRAFSRWDGSARSRRVMVLLNEVERDALSVTPEPNGFGYAFSGHAGTKAGGERHVSVQASRIATLLPNIGHIRGSAVRSGEGSFSVNEGVRTASWIEHGVAYSLELECFDPEAANCDDAALRELVAELVYVGGAAAGGAT